MRQKIATFAAVAALVVGCSKSATKVQRGQEQYQVVQEGSASGVTSTINGAGGTTPPMTDTNVDTTSNFTLPTNPNPLGNGAPIPSAPAIAGTLPAGAPAGTPPMASSAPSYSAPRAPRVRTSTEPVHASTANAPVVTDTVGSTTPPMPREHHDSGSQTSTSSNTPPANDTTSTAAPATDTQQTNTAPPSSDQPKKDDKNAKPPADQPKEQQQQQQSPPPPTTDTQG